MEKTVKSLSFEILKPHKPGLVELTHTLVSLTGVEGVKIDLKDSEQNTETVNLTLEGKLSYPKIKKAIEENGGVIHSVNSVVAGKFSG